MAEFSARPTGPVGGRAAVIHQGDCLEIMAAMRSETVDLIYADPPFGPGTPFSDSWEGSTVEDFVEWMRPRVVEMRRLLTPSGSLYLHCDPKTSHYLKIMMDGIFGRGNFRNEIVWAYRRWPAKHPNFQRMHDVILRYALSGEATWNQLFEPLAESTLKQWGDMKQEKVFDEFGKQRSISTTTKSAGAPMRDVWDISVIAPSARERVGYPTQKPLALLDRIIRASSNPDDVVLDPFCGSGTTLVAAQQLGRQWIGIDRSPEAIATAAGRLSQTPAQRDLWGGAGAD